MREFIKNTIYTSIGIATVTNEKFKELVEDLIQNNHYTKDEGKRITDNFLFEMREQLDHVNGVIQVRFDELLKKFGLSGIHSLMDEVDNYAKEVKADPTILLKLPYKK